MSLLLFLQGLRSPALDTFFSLLTYLGDETVFFIVAMVFFWCVDRREGYYLIFTGLLGTLCNQILKILCRVPRPWIRNPDLHPVDAAVDRATGYSFPSGHTQCAVGTFGAIARTHRQKAIRITAIVLAVLVSFSRLYLGVHTPQDVAVSAVIALALVFLLYPVFSDPDRFRRRMPLLLGISLFLATAFLVIAFSVNESFADAKNLADARKNACTLFGCAAGLLLMYLFDRKKGGFSTAAPLGAQVLKSAVGLSLILLLKLGLPTVFGFFCFGNAYAARVLTYLSLALFGGVLYPLTFPLFARVFSGKTSAAGKETEKENEQKH